MGAAVEAVEVVQLIDALEIANAAIDHESGFGSAGDGCTEVVADKGAVLDLAEEVDHQDISWAEGVDDPGVLTAGATFCSAGLDDGAMDVGTVGDISGCHRATNHD